MIDCMIHSPVYTKLHWKSFKQAAMILCGRGNLTLTQFHCLNAKINMATVFYKCGYIQAITKLPLLSFYNIISAKHNGFLKIPETVEVTIPVAQWTKMVKCKAASVPKHHA